MIPHSLVVAVSVLLLATAAAGAPPPSILHIHADDWKADAVGALGNPDVQTPHLDKLARSGLVFTCCYTQGSMVGAVCLPSRTMLLTGRSWQRIPGRGEAGAGPALPALLAAAGYETWHMGKGGNEYSAGLAAFQTNLIDNGSGKDAGTDRAGSSRRLADRAIEFLKSRDRTKPFYAYLAPPVPHDPREAEPQFHRLYDAARIALPPAFMPEHPWNNGEARVRDEMLAPFPRTPEDTRRQLAEYYACLTGFDHHIGRILAALGESGQREDTLVVFTSDNGLSMGEHGLFGKQNLYEFGGMHVPCIIAGPGVPEGRSAALVYLMDFYATFADYAGARLPEGVEGRSLRPVIEGRSARVRDRLYTGYKDCQRSVRDERWKLIRYPLVDRTQLFDLRADPRELSNLFGQPGHEAKAGELMRALEEEMKLAGDPWPLRPADPPADGNSRVNPAPATKNGKGPRRNGAK